LEEDGLKETAVTATGKNRIMIYGSKNDGTYIVEFKTAEGEALAISVPAISFMIAPTSGLDTVPSLTTSC
jgi:hypothetical protein